MPYRVQFTTRSSEPGELWYEHEDDATHAAEALQAAGCEPQVWLASVMDLPKHIRRTGAVKRRRRRGSYSAQDLRPRENAPPRG